MYVIQHCFICRPSDSTVSDFSGIELKTVATLALTARRSNHSAKSYPHYTYILYFYLYIYIYKFGLENRWTWTQNDAEYLLFIVQLFNLSFQASKVVLRKQRFQFQRTELLFERRHNNEEWRRLKLSEDSKLVRNMFVFCI
jgi:hypothetical protein